ncbi:MAG: hypothetical protein Q9174_004209 [Haloplaca sp. 1 TL-2023]
MWLPCFSSVVIQVLAGLTVIHALPTFTLEDLRSSLALPKPHSSSKDKRSPLEVHHEHLHSKREHVRELQKRQQVTCDNPDALFFVECWDILDIPNYLIAPQTGWINTVRTCQDTGGSPEDNDGSTCCVKDEAWATCYLRLAIPGTSADCTSPSGDRCDQAIINQIRVPEVTHPWVRYTVKNIYGTLSLERISDPCVWKLIDFLAINNYFITYFDALYNAAGLVGDQVAQMIQFVDVIVPPVFPFQNLLLGLAVGLAFLTAPSIALRMIQLEAATLSASAQIIAISAQQAPNIGRAIWPAGTDNSQLVQAADLSVQLSNITQQMSSQIDQAVRLLMTDIGTFQNFADSGRYSGPNVTNTGEGTGLTVPSATVAVGYALKTYLITEAMRQNKWYGTFDIGPFVSRTDVESKLACKYDAAGNYCLPSAGFGEGGDRDRAIYWSPWSQRAYTLRVNGPPNAQKPPDMLDIIISYEWSPLDVMFDGAFNCTAQGAAGTKDVHFNDDGTLDLSCTSQLPMYIPCGDMCPTAQGLDGKCPFSDTSAVVDGDCKNYEGWY